jgi:sugar phosphate isomerase/epimerase
MYWIRKVEGRMDVVHFKEMGVTKEREQIMVPVGQGNMNWPGIIAACNETGVKYAFVEQDKCAKDPFDCLRDSFNYLSGQEMEI